MSKLWMIAFLGCLASAAAAAAESQPPAVRLTRQWIDAYGNISPLDWSHKEQWSWEKIAGSSGFKRLVLRAWLELPKGSAFLGVKGSRVRYALFPPRSPRWLGIDITRPLTTLKIELKSKDGAVASRGLILQAETDVPGVQGDSNCARQGISIEPASPLTRRSGTSSPLFVGISCAPEGNPVGVEVSHSEDTGVSFKASSAVQRDEKTGLYRIALEIPRDGSGRSPLALGRFSLKEGRGGTGGIPFNLVFRPPRRNPSRWAVSAGVGPTYLSYLEEPIGIRVQEIGITGKFNAAFALIPRKIDLAANVFGNLIPVSVSSSPGAPNARFYGLNARVGWHVPLPRAMRENAYDLVLSPGWYLWGMLVPNDVYGIQALMGPQLFVSLRKTLANGHWLGSYLKFASITDGAMLSKLSNHELALGGSYLISRPDSERPLSLTLDLSDVVFASSTSDNQLGLLTVSAGIQMGF